MYILRVQDLIVEALGSSVTSGASAPWTTQRCPPPEVVERDGQWADPPGSKFLELFGTHSSSLPSYWLPPEAGFELARPAGPEASQAYPSPP